MVRVRLSLYCGFLLGTMVSTAAATDGAGVNWTILSTGYQNGQTSGNRVNTAVAMRGAWPVVFNVDSSNEVQAYSLYPVLNSATGTYWHQIGFNLLPFPTTSTTLSAVTGPNGSFGVDSRSNFTFSGGTATDSSTAVVGNSSGFGSVLSGVRSMAFTTQGTLVTANANSVPLLPPTAGNSQPQQLVSIAVAPNGEEGAIDNQGNYYEKGPMLGGWQSSSLGLSTTFSSAGNTYNYDYYKPVLAMDKNGMPVVVTDCYNSSSGSGCIVASDFNPITESWTSQTLVSLGTLAMGSRPEVAADGLGGVGAAWVQNSTSGPELMYAYENGNGVWTSHLVTSSVLGLSGSSDIVGLSQHVGLTFDANNLPVISFVAGSTQNVYLAYDPITVPEPCTLSLLSAGGLLLCFAAAKSRRRRLVG